MATYNGEQCHRVVGMGWILYLVTITVTSVTATKEACDVCECIKSIPIVDCSNRALLELPAGLPNDTELLNLTGNFLQEIPNGRLLDFKFLTVLTLTRNSITKPFEVPPSLVTLVANENKLQDIKPMLKNGINLKTVEFTKNNLSVIEADTFRACTELFRLKLSDNMISHIEPGGLTGPNTLSHLVMANNKLDELGPMDGLIFINLAASYNGLKRLKPHTFANMEGFGRIDLENNRLERIPTELFLDPISTRHDKQMEYANFRRNRITYVSSGAFKGVRVIYHLQMAQNKLTSLPEDLLANTSIMILDLSSNELTHFPSTLLRSQTKLITLHLQQNKIGVLDRTMFQGLQSLITLMIFQNPIVKVADWQFYETKLENIFMFQAGITSLGVRPFATKENTIKYVLLHGNHIEKIENTVWQDLASNCYVSIDQSLRFVPHIGLNRTDIVVELVGGDFVQPINTTDKLAEVLRSSGFSCPEMTHTKPTQCTPCPQGTYGAWPDSCKLCPPGGFYQQKTGQVADGTGMNCQKCNNGTYVTPESHPGRSLADCTVCPEGTNKNLHAGFRACPCIDNYYRTDRFSECRLCPRDGINCSGEYQHLLRGFWWTWEWGSHDAISNYQAYLQFVQNVRIEDASYDQNTQRFGGKLPNVYPCPHKDSCVNDGDGIDSSCKVGHTGWLCVQCSEYYYSWFGQCQQCPKEKWLFLLEVVAVFVVIALIIIAITLYSLRSNRRGERSLVSVFLARVKILIGYIQVICEIFSALYEIPWPPILKEFGSFFQLLKINILQLLISPRCFFPKFDYPNIYIEFLTGLSFVVAVVFLPWCYYCFRKWLVAKSPEGGQDVLTKTKQRCFLFVVMLLFVSYPSMCGVIITLLPTGCKEFYLGENQSEPIVEKLRYDYSIDCKDEGHLPFIYAAETAIVYIVGFPIVLLLLLRSSKRRKSSERCHLTFVAGGDQPLDDNFGESTTTDMDNATTTETHNIQQISHTLPPNQNQIGTDLDDVFTDVSQTGSGSEQSLSIVSQDSTWNDDSWVMASHEDDAVTNDRDQISWFSFLCENYKDEFWYWEIVELSRKILQTLFILLFGPEDHFALFASIVLSVVFLLLQSYWKPMKDAAEHRLQLCSLGTIFLNLLAASLLLLPSDTSDTSEIRKAILAVMLVLLNLSIIVFVAASSIWSGLKALWSLGCCRSIMKHIVQMVTWCRQRYPMNEGNINRHPGNGDGSLLITNGHDTEGE